MKANARICSSVNAPGEIESNFLMEELELESATAYMAAAW